MGIDVLKQCIEQRTFKVS